jgi:predicted phage tail protein
MTDKRKIIRGSKGGSPPPPPQPTRTPDTLHSKQFATFLDLISEGEIEGSASASKEGITDKTSTAYKNAYLKDVFLNDTPILRSTASSTDPQDVDFNFQDVTFNSRHGTANQTKIDGIESSQSTIPVGVTVTAASPVTRQITNTDVDRIRVSITFPQIQIATEQGDLLGDTVQFKISVQYNSGGFTDIHTDTVTGRTADAYQKDFSVKITGSFPVDIRVTRITADSTSSSTINAFQWTSFTEIIDDASTYANSAYNAIRLDSQQFSSIPSRKFRIRGIKVRIPGAGASSSGTPTVDTATGRIVYPSGYIFNGVMGAAVWTSCPAMILLDLLTNTRYGFGDHITDSNLDLFSFVTASKYANTLVDDGFGGQEARFSCNVNIQTSSEAFDLINELSGVMRCMPIFSAGSITITQDSPKDASYLFNLSNVTSEGFNYSGSSLKQRHTAVAVSYFNMDSQEIDFEVVEDSTAQSKFGIITKQVKAFGCTSRGQAARLGRAILFAEQNESELVSFSTSIDAGAVVRPGAIIDINDPVRAGVRRGGRLSAVASTTVMTIDDANASDLATTNSPTFSVVLPDGTVETKDVSSIDSSGVVTVSSAFSQTPNVNTVWLLQNTTVQAQKFRVITVEEQDGINFSITALSYVEGKYAFIEDGSSLPTRSVSVLNELKPPPSNLSAVETIVPINNQAVSKIFISWQPIVGVIEYQVNYRFENSNFVTEKVSRPDFEIKNSQLGTYEIQVFSYNVQGQLSATSNDLTFEAIGKTARPQDVTNLRIEPISDQFVRLRFDKATDVDVTHGGNVVVRASNLADGTATFTNSVDVIPALPGNVSESIVPNIVNGEYILKFRDDGGRLSEGETSVIVTSPDPFPKLTVLTDREDTDSPPFAGTKVDCFFSDDVNGLVLGSLVTLDDEADFDSIADFDFLGAVDITGGSYEFANTLDLGGKQPLRLRRHFVTQGFYPNDLIDKRSANIDTWTDFDAATAFDVGASLLVAVTDLDPDLSTSATYGQSGTTITITKTAHGYSVGDFVVIDFTAGSATDGNYEITSKTDNTFTVTSATSATISSGTACTYGANFTRFNPFVNGTYVGRGFKFRCEMDSDDPAQSIEIDQLGYTAELESRTETSLGNAGATGGGIISSGTSQKSVTFTNSFFTGQSGTSVAANSVLPSIAITIENAQSGDFFALSSITGSGFNIDIKNGSSHVNREFKYSATGFGRGS